MREMLGQATALAAPVPGRWVRRIWGSGDIHARQKWSTVWRLLAHYPRGPLRLLDAGCGSGDWALELAARRPDWTIVGIDRDGARVAYAEASRRALGRTNVSFSVAGFLDYVPPHPYDVVLSVSSAHYLAQSGEGMQLFARFRSWLVPGGKLLVLAPRSRREVGFLRALRSPPWHTVFTAQELAELCAGNALRVERLDGRIGRLGTLAKQLAWSLDAVLGRGSAIGYPIELGLTALDQWRSPGPGAQSLMWLLEARAHE